MASAKSKQANRKVEGLDLLFGVTVPTYKEPMNDLAGSTNEETADSIICHVSTTHKTCIEDGLGNALGNVFAQIARWE
eukprot:2731107-Rhodomonas_salina.1